MIGYLPAAPSTQRSPARAAAFCSIAAVGPRQFRRHRPDCRNRFGDRAELPAWPLAGGRRRIAGVADRMRKRSRPPPAAKDAIVLGNGYAASSRQCDPPSRDRPGSSCDGGAAFSEGARGVLQHGRASKAKRLSAITDVALRRLFAPDFQAAHPDLMADRRAGFCAPTSMCLRACDARRASMRPDPEG